MLPKNKASRAQQYLMYFYSNGWQCCCFSYIITKILWFSCILTKVTPDLHLIHLTQKWPLSQKQGRERPYCVQRTPVILTLSSWDIKKGQRKIKHHLQKTVFLQPSVRAENIHRRWATWVKTKLGVLTNPTKAWIRIIKSCWFKYPHSIWKNHLKTHRCRFNSPYSSASPLGEHQLNDPTCANTVRPLTTD